MSLCGQIFRDTAGRPLRFSHCRAPLIRCLCLYWMVGIEPSSRALIVEGKGWFEAQCVADISPFLTQIPLHMDVPLQKPSVSHGGGEGQWKVWHDFRENSLQLQSLSNTTKGGSFASELSSREASTRTAVTMTARLKFSVAVDVLDWQPLLTWLRSPPPSLQCLLHCTT